MNIKLTLNEILNRCSNWEYFCEEEGWSGDTSMVVASA